MCKFMFLYVYFLIVLFIFCIYTLNKPLLGGPSAPPSFCEGLRPSPPPKNKLTSIKFGVSGKIGKITDLCIFGSFRFILDDLFHFFICVFCRCAWWSVLGAHKNYGCRCVWVGSGAIRAL